MDTFLADRRVHDEINLTVGDQVKDMRAAFVELFDRFCLDACLGDSFVCSAGSNNLKACFFKELRNLDNFRLILAVDGD